MTIYRNGKAIVLTADEMESIYRGMEARYHAEDIYNYAKELGIKVTRKEAKLIADEIWYSILNCNLNYWENIEAMIIYYKRKNK